jgi:hypothetical protein
MKNWTVFIKVCKDNQCFMKYLFKMIPCKKSCKIVFFAFTAQVCYTLLIHRFEVINFGQLVSETYTVIRVYQKFL